MNYELKAAMKEIEQDLVKVTEPDYAEIGNVIREIKGEDRTMKQFARDTGISAPTLSRIMNGKITKPITLENMVSLAAHAYDESKSVALILKLARANGYMSHAEQRALKEKMRWKDALLELHKSREAMMAMVIKSALFERGCGMDPEVLEIRNGELPTAVRSTLKYDFDLDISGELGEYRWIFFCIPQMSDDWNEEGIKLDRLIKQLVKEVSPIFVTDAWMPELYKDYKISFCFADDTLYDLFLLSLSQAKFNNRFSAILINDGKCRLEEEHQFESADHSDETSLLDLPPTIGISYSDNGVVEELTGNDFIFIEDVDDEEGS